ncbi:MAG TPA: FAD-dependent oxidoreductase [Chitinophagaceae bacterium]|jgi:glycine/D-amino acid oxidase-like deaminating enzyme|nr:FAD-dependent oxidoreductase [Chitinophagaceae bacterium]
MKLSSGYPLSLIKNGLLFSYPKLERDIKTDVLVLGGGISGALAAHYLTQEGIGCTLVDARTIGLGSTCASTSLLQYEIDTPLHLLIGMVGEKNAVRSYKLGASAITKLATLAAKTGIPDFEMQKSLYYAAYKKDISYLEKEFESRTKYGFKVKWLEEDQVFKQFGFSSPGGILSDVAATVDAYLLTHHLLQYNINKGLKVYDRTPVVSIKHNRRNVQLKTQEKFTITAKKLVYATGYEVVDFISKPIVKLTSTYAIASEAFNSPVKLGKTNAVIWNTAKPYLYLRSTNDNRIIIGGRDEEFFSHFKRDKLIPGKAKQLQKDFKKIFPSIPFKTEFSWAGTFGSTKDGLPYIGVYEKLLNSFFALGFGGNGITFSQVAGEIIASLIKGKKNKDADIFSFER